MVRRRQEVQSQFPIFFFANDALYFTKANSAEANTLKTSLCEYEKASSQQVSLTKSSVMFSSNVASGDRAALCATLGVEEASYGNYLGMPSTIGRNKKQVFQYVV